jgi:protein-tyrosine-phosphatase
MAEAIFNTLNNEHGIRAMSAGINPADRIQPETLEVLKEKGFDTQDLFPSLVTPEMMANSFKVIAMDPWVAEQLEGRANETWDIPDPYRNPIDSYRRTRDILIGKIDELITNLQ